MDVTTHQPSADVAWLQVNWKTGKVSSVVLTRTGGSTYVLRGRQMYAWLKEFSPRFELPGTTRRTPSLQTSKGSVRNDAQAHFAWREQTQEARVLLGRSPVPADTGDDG